MHIFLDFYPGINFYGTLINSKLKNAVVISAT